MSKKELGMRLKQLRQAYGWSKKELAEKIDLTEQAVNNIELGRRQIYADDLKLISKAFNITCEEFFEFELDSNLDQTRLLHLYSGLSQVSKNLVMHTAEELYEIEQNRKVLILPMINESKIKTRDLIYYDQAAGMGSGQTVENAIPSKITVPEKQIPPNTDFVIRVYGDSMEPTFHSDDKLYIQETQELKVGDIGVFSYNGEQLVKELGNGELISHNKYYEPIRIKGVLYIQGKVLGKV